MEASRVCIAAMAGLGWLFLCSVSLAVEPPSAEPPTPSGERLIDYKSKRLRVRTDLPRQKADALFTRLEETLEFASRYWGRTPRGQIKCYVVDDLDNWSDAELPHQLARVIVFGVGGATLPNTVGAGNRTRNEPTVYASSRRGVAEHEIIHAYCTQTFRSTGPEWYREGMAEMVVRGCTRESGMRCSEEQLASLRSSKPRSVEEIIAVGATAGRISAALKLMLTDPVHRGRHVPSTAWTQRDTANVAQARDEYLRSWAFCYMMLHNPNYAKRFRTLGQAFVKKQPRAFDEFFAPVRHQIAFEYEFLLDHMTDGYRVDLCRWDWQARFKQLEPGDSHRTRVVAARGFQASGLTVAAGQRYRYQAKGEWSTAANEEGTDADGLGDDAGRLVGVVMQGDKLSKPFLLGADGSFEGPANGRLYLRCNDAWNELADNQGQIVVRFNLP